MLYDNALLLRVYGHLGRLTGAALPLRVARETAEFLLRRPAHRRRVASPPRWTPTPTASRGSPTRGPRRSSARCSAEADGEWAAHAARGDRGGHLRARHARRCSCPPTRTTRRAGSGFGCALLAARLAAATTGPGRQGGHRLERAGDRCPGRGRVARSSGRTGCAALPSARTCCSIGTSWTGALRRSSRDGVVGAAAGVLEDYGVLADGAARAAPGDGLRRLAGGGVRDARPALAHFADPDVAGRVLRHRGRRRDAVAPAPGDHRQRHAELAASALAGALLTASVLVDGPRGRYRAAAEAALHRGGRAWPGAIPRFAGHWLTRRRGRGAGPAAGRGGRLGRRPGRALPVTPARIAPGGTVDRGRPAGRSAACRCSPSGRWSTARAAAYVCRGFVCDRPVTSVEELTLRPPRCASGCRVVAGIAVAV